MFNGIQYVNGTEGANRYNCYPNSQVLLMDTTRNVFYIKTTDTMGNATIQTFEFKEIKETNPNAFVTRKELDDLFKKYLGGVVENESIDIAESTDNSTDTGTL